MHSLRLFVTFASMIGDGGTAPGALLMSDFR
jgi:hypothetical protein